MASDKIFNYLSEVSFKNLNEPGLLVAFGQVKVTEVFLKNSLKNFLKISSKSQK